MAREKERIQKQEEAKLKEVEEEEEEDDQPLERRREQRGQYSGSKDDEMEKRISEWVASLSLGEEEEVAMYIPKDEQEAAMKEWEAERDAVRRQAMEDETRMEWKLRVMREKKRKVDAAIDAVKDLGEMQQLTLRLTPQVDLEKKVELIAQTVERLAQIQEQQYDFSRSQDMAVRSIRMGFRDFARELVGAIGSEAYFHLEKNGKVEKVLHSLTLLVEDNLPFDIVLGMDWGEAAEATLHLKEHECRLPSSSGEAETARLFHVSGVENSLAHCCLSAPAFTRLVKKEKLEEQVFVAYVRLVTEPTEEKSMDPTIAKLLEEFKDLTEPPIGVVLRPIQHRIEIEPDSGTPKGAVYRMSPRELEELRKQLDELLEKGWIRPSSSLFGAPVLFVPKKEGELRMCIDYRGLNAITVKNAEPLPRIDDLLDRVQGAKYFSKIDLKFGYHQIEVHPDDQYKTAFRTRYGHYEFIVMPFGLTNAPATFQRCMNDLCRPWLDRFVVVYLDDILVFSRTLEEHQGHLRQVLEKLREANFKINAKKCDWAKTQVLYLGHVLDRDGVKPEDSKIEAIRDQGHLRQVLEKLREANSFLQREEWDNMVKVLMNAHESFRYAKYEKARTTRVEATKGRVTARVEELRRQWPSTVCMLQLDGWTDRRSRPHINVMVSFPKGAIFWRSVCMSNRENGVTSYYEILKRAIKEVGPDAVVGIVMDNAAVCAAAGRMIEAEFPHIFSIGCTAYNIDLMLEAFTKIGWVDAAIKRAVEVAKYFTNHTRVMETSKGLLGLLKFVDGDGPTISKIYGRMDNLVEKLRENEVFTEMEKDELEAIIMRRWNAMTSPLHCAAMFLDPELKASKPEQDLEVADGFWTWVYSWCKRPMYKTVDEEVNNWIDGVGKFRSEKAIEEARGTQPARWWRKWCSELPHLQRQAIRLLSQGSSSSSCERNWSLFERIHSRPRNELESVKLSTLVYNRWNQHLLKQLTKKPKAGEDDLLWEENLDLEKKEVAADAAMRVDEWRSRVRELNEGWEDSDDDDAEEDDDDEDAVEEEEERERGTGQMVRTRIESDLLELETQLNESWQKSTKASKYLARLHLGELQQAMKTMGDPHADKYMASRPKASALSPQTVKRGPGRPQKVVEEAAAMEESGGGKETAEEGGATAKRPPGKPRKAVEETSATEESGRADDNAAEEEDCDSDEQPLHCGK
ncbi:hypothetical protein CBR_g50163 [Chara braunii]|uniref:Reverse transcriptase domain-containing protein n=1 Tax=Chara braunii TaxID=69332 RepID=A0A388M6A4_CHABU|nr:hypothetical protein CBR_g50163 [Chara braunii]|eukprot:GBG90070.1 hypothetical protein CBR_g50163 [Chara braunii]